MELTLFHISEASRPPIEPAPVALAQEFKLGAVSELFIEKLATCLSYDTPPYSYTKKEKLIQCIGVVYSTVYERWLTISSASVVTSLRTRSMLSSRALTSETGEV
jgi:hypothetical protein